MYNVDTETARQSYCMYSQKQADLARGTDRQNYVDTETDRQSYVDTEIDRQSYVYTETWTGRAMSSPRQIGRVM